MQSHSAAAKTPDLARPDIPAPLEVRFSRPEPAGFPWASALALSLLYFCLSFSWSRLIPFDDAPDEWAQYYFNIHYVLEHGELPVSGRDDVPAFLSGRFNPFGSTSARYSYNVYPPINYFLSVLTARIANSLLGWPPEMGARLASVFYGAAFVFFLTGALFPLTGSRRTSIWVAAIAAFIPQVIFISSYVNQDIFSLFVSAFLAFSFVHFFKRSSPLSCALLGISLGLLMCCKYNYFIYFPFYAALLGYALQQRSSAGLRMRIALWCLVSCLVPLMFYLRNYFLYGDIFGQNFVRQTMLEHQGRLGVQQEFSFSTLNYLLQRGFFFDTFKSAFAEFGYLSLQLEQASYSQFYWWTALSLLSFTVLYLRQAGKAEMLALAALALFVLGSCSLYLYNSLIWDYQAQGRYLFPIIVPAALFIAFAISRFDILKIPLGVFTCALMLVLLESQTLLLKTYHPGNIAARGYAVSQAQVVGAPQAASGYEQAAKAEPIEVIPGERLRQVFRSNAAGLSGVAVWVAQDATRTLNLHHLTLRDPNGILLRESYVFPFEFRAGQSVTFAFKQVPDSLGREYILELEAIPNIPSPSTRFESVVSTNIHAYAAQIGTRSVNRTLSLTLVFE